MGEIRLFVQRDSLSVKVEVNTVIRGTVYPTQKLALTPAASDALMADLQLTLLAPQEVNGGKLVAAKDPQHPRDLFDVMELFAHGGITSEIRRASVVYLVSRLTQSHHPRSTVPPAPKGIQLAYEGSFVGMTTAPVNAGSDRSELDSANDALQTRSRR